MECSRFVGILAQRKNHRLIFLLSELLENPKQTLASDIWAFAFLCLEVRSLVRTEIILIFIRFSSRFLLAYTHSTALRRYL